MNDCAGIDQQRGAALLVALVCAAIAAILALGLVERTQTAMARTEALMASERAWQFAGGMNVLAEDAIARARDSALAATALDGTWTAPFEVPGGFVQGRMTDQGGRFNLNALAHPDPEQAMFARAAFERLLIHLGLNTAIADDLATWLGAAGSVIAGAEDDWYTRLVPPYRSARQPLAHASELRWLRSVDEQAWVALADRVTALPTTVLVVNVNRADPFVLAAVAEMPSVDEARRLIADGPFRELNEVLAHPLMQAAPAGGIAPYLSVQGNWYLAQARVVLDGIERDFFRLIGPGMPGYDDFRFVSQGVY